jgi:hypothetical protein
MVAKEVFVNYPNLNPIWVQHASIPSKKVLGLKSKSNRQGTVCNKIYSEPGLEPEPRFEFAAPWSRSRKK